ncbi:MAG: pimeloyl-CoA dehydrogenase small subunit [Acetobacteraceae bacterium]|nr:pimeloyl-CoA dehydrogenase small subunit [Acetobacteraceae bacterium]MSP29952.1 pimeloyl-CoA dehydrogenase small subunit [Acetobacteraceae bacterium]
MDLSHTAEQLALRESAARFLRDRYSFETRRRIEASAEGFDAEIWRAFADLGWLALPFPADDGGLDGGAIDLALLMETFGAALVMEPYVSSVVLCGGLIAAAGSGGQRAELIAEILAGRLVLAFAHHEPAARHEYGRVGTSAVRMGNGWRLDGQKSIVLDAPMADRFLVTAQVGEDGGTAALGLFLVAKQAPGMNVTEYRIVDGRRAGSIVLDGVIVGAEAKLGGGQDRAETIAAVTDRAVVALAADTIGAMQVLLDKTIAHTKTRVQFGQPLAANQVLKHRMVNMAVRIEEARSIAMKAAIRADDGSGAAVRGQAVSAAKVKVAAAARFVAEQAVQLHGAMGVTDELDIGAYFRRIMAFEASYGTPAWHLKRYAALRDV